jgi:hypothetical protein
MPQIALQTLLDLVGDLSDNPDPGSASARFRKYLRENVRDVADLRSYVNNALGTSGDQFNKALQDLINHLGRLLGFRVEYGRYRGARNAIGFDGLWQSPSGQVIVVETKTTDVYTVKTATLLSYINDLVSEGRIENRDGTLGLYVYGRFDAKSNQLKNAIIAERRQEKLRVISVDALLNLLELKQEYDLGHDAVLDLLLPTPVEVDPLVDLIFDMISQEKREAVETQLKMVETEQASNHESTAGSDYYLLPAADAEDDVRVIDNLHRWLDQKLWGLGERTAYRRDFSPGDHLCFYAVRKGIVAEATVSSRCFELTSRKSPVNYKVPYAIHLDNIYWLKEVVELSEEVRSRLSAFQDRDPSKGWAWFVQGTSKMTKRDFEILTGKLSVSKDSSPSHKIVDRPENQIGLISIDQDYRGCTIESIIFQGQRHQVSSWKDAMLVLLEELWNREGKTFARLVMGLKGRKRYYFSYDPDQLVRSESISDSGIYVEVNFSANSIVRLCRTVVSKLEYGEDSLIFEAV